MNLIVVDKCTNYCKYCFASTEMAKNNSKAFLKEENIPHIIEYIKNSGENFELNIIGGEPFLYRQLPILLTKVLELENVSKVCIFTGGIASAKSVEQILHFDNDKVTFLFNINEKKDYHTEKEYELVLSNFDLVLSYGFRAIFGFNIYKENFNTKEILDLCKKYGTPVLRWTVAFPELKPSPFTQTLKPNQYSDVSSRVADFLEEAYLNNISALLDCPLPKCFFNYEQMGRIALTQPLTLNSIKSCGPVVDVTPDLEVFRCYALSSLNRKHLTDFHNFQETIAFYKENIDDLYHIPTTFSYCKECEFALNQTCYGGCIAHSPNSVNQRISKDELVNKMFEHLNNCDFEEVKNIFYNKVHNLFKNSIANYIMSFVAEQENKTEEAETYLRKSIINATSSENAKEFAKRLQTIQQYTVFNETKNH